MEIKEHGRGGYGWQPGQNLAFAMIAVGMVLAGLLAWLL